MSFSSLRLFVSSQLWTGELLNVQSLCGWFFHKGEIIFSIDICQFSMTSLWSSSEDKNRSISFRSIILIMIYAGTIILNLLAASVDNKFPIMNSLSHENSTLISDSDDKQDSVFVATQD